MNNTFEMISNQELECLKDSFCTILSFIILKRNGLLPKVFEQQENEIPNDHDNNQKTILSKQEVLEQYPMFTETSLNKAVKYQGLEFIKVGRSRYYDRNSVENWLLNRKEKEEYNRFESIKF